MDFLREKIRKIDWLFLVASLCVGVAIGTVAFLAARQGSVSRDASQQTELMRLEAKLDALIESEQ